MKNLILILLTFFRFGLIVLDTFVAGSIAVVILMVRRKDIAEKIVFEQMARNWGRRLLRYVGGTISIRGMENIDWNKKYLILCNHQSNLDVLVLLGHLPLRLLFISKRLIFKIPIIGYIMNRMGCIPMKRNNRRSSIQSIETAATILSRSMASILMFPEGTRSPDGKLQPLKKGFIHLLERVTEDVMILPIMIKGTFKILPKHAIKLTPGGIVLNLHPPIQVDLKKIKTIDYKETLYQQVTQTISSPSVHND